MAPENNVDRFNQIADEFLGIRSDWTAMYHHCDKQIQDARQILADAEDGDFTPEERAAECLREAKKPLIRLAYLMNQLHAVIDMPPPFPGVR